MTHPVTDRAAWLVQRRVLLEAEKEHLAQRDDLARRRRELPWVRVDEDYSFESADGSRSLEELFDGRTQLLIYHFMMGPKWDEGCPSCSFWADGFDGVGVHLAHRDVSFAAVSRAPVESIEAYRRRMGWSFPWYSSLGSSFNFDFGVSFGDDGPTDSPTYNFAPIENPSEEMPGLSAFIRDNGSIFHTYSTYSRGLDGFNTAYQLLDLAPRGRDEDDLDFTMSWLRRHDDYPV
jgi:predicted dithiol-disulfide oxidoreductase (DUF899 family)